MNQKTICAAIIALTATLAGNAQQATTVTAPARASTNTVMAYANGNDSYLRYSNKGYDAKKKYVVLKFWSEKEPQSESEKQDIAYLKKHLAKKDIEVVDFEWKTEEDLKKVLDKYNLTVNVINDKRVHVKNENFSVNTTSGKALIVIEDNKPFSICSGKKCESNLKGYFKLQSVN